MAKRLGPHLASARVVSGAPLVKSKAQTGAGVLGDPSWTVGSVRVVTQWRAKAVTQWRYSKLRWRLGFRALMNKISAGGGSFYRGLDPMPKGRRSPTNSKPNPLPNREESNKKEKGIKSSSVILEFITNSAFG
jgi:hypothetical protein